jgi:ABC-type Fe3+ transport system permease subunit
MADRPRSSGAIIARNVAAVLGAITLIVYLAMRFSDSHVSADGYDCGTLSTPMAVPYGELSACANAFDSFHLTLGLTVGAAIVLVIVAVTIHVSVTRSSDR